MLVLRSAQMGAWHTEHELFKQVAAALAQVTQAYLREGSAQSLFAAKSALAGALAKSKNSFDTTEEYRLAGTPFFNFCFFFSGLAYCFFFFRMTQRHWPRSRLRCLFQSMCGIFP